MLFLSSGLMYWSEELVILWRLVALEVITQTHERVSGGRAWRRPVGTGNRNRNMVLPSQKGNGIVTKSCLFQTPFGLEMGSEKPFSEEPK
jgi:hypothetical protein